MVLPGYTSVRRSKRTRRLRSVPLLLPFISLIRAWKMEVSHFPLLGGRCDRLTLARFAPLGPSDKGVREAATAIMQDIRRTQG